MRHNIDNIHATKTTTPTCIRSCFFFRHAQQILLEFREGVALVPVSAEIREGVVLVPVSSP